LFETRLALLGWVGAVLSLGTVLTTSMIYTQMKTVPRWNTALTPALLIAISLAGGALLAGEISAALILIPIAGVLQILWWVRGDGAFAASGTDMATATSLGNIGTVRSFEPPHTGTNYLLREMVHQIGRKHAVKLRVIAFGLGYVLPVALLLLPFSHLLALVAVLTHVAGIAISRWLFFAEAEHVVGLYYGKR
jgi:DMSO reductase anchor subunit